MYLLDTDILIDLCRDRFRLQDRVAAAGIKNCMISEISLAEFYVGVNKSKNPRLEKEAVFIAETFAVIPISGALKTYAQLRAQLEQKGTRLDTMDLFIAATAIDNGYTLVSHNTRHFSRIPGLQLEDWLEE